MSSPSRKYKPEEQQPKPLDEMDVMQREMARLASERLIRETGGRAGAFQSRKERRRRSSLLTDEPYREPGAKRLTGM